MGSAVPYRQELGRRSAAWYGRLSGCAPWGYSTTWFQLSTASSLVAELPEE